MTRKRAPHGRPWPAAAVRTQAKMQQAHMPCNRVRGTALFVIVIADDHRTPSVSERARALRDGHGAG